MVRNTIVFTLFLVVLILMLEKWKHHYNLAILFIELQKRLYVWLYYCICLF